MNFFATNTLARVERLEQTGLPREQAVAIVQSQQEVFEHAVINTLATKSDLSEIKVDIIKWVAGMLVAQAAVVSSLVKLI